MAQEFFIKSGQLEQKVRELLPSQGGLGAGFDLSASTQIIPIVDLTESAEGSNLRSDLQRAQTIGSPIVTVENGNSTLVSNTGFWEINYTTNASAAAASGDIRFQITDGATTAIIKLIEYETNTDQIIVDKFTVFLPASHSLVLVSSANNIKCFANARQIATIDGTLVDPLGYS